MLRFSKMWTSGLSNPEAKERAYILCRVGEYRKAATLALSQRKSYTGPANKYDMALPLALSKCGHYRASILVATKLARSTSTLQADLIEIASDCLKNINITSSDVINILDYCKSIRLSPGEAASIAAGIRDQKVQSLFLDEARSRYGYSSEDLNYIAACVSYMKEDIPAALRLLQPNQENGRLSTASAKLSARILSQTGHLYSARRYACFAIRSNRHDAEALNILGHVLYQEAKWKAARKVYSLVHQITADELSKLNMCFILPRVAVSLNDLANAFESFKGNLANFSDQEDFIGIENALRLSFPICLSFYLAYQGSINLKWLLEAYYRIIRSSARKIVNENIFFHSPCGKERSIRFHHSKGHGKIRIGFISRNFHQHSNLQAHQGLIKGLNRDIFEISIIHRHGAIEDTAHIDLNESVDKTIYLSADFGAGCKRIADLKLAVLFFTDIGMFPLDGILPMIRLATHQVTSWGLPHTTGLSEIDHYLRSKIFDDCEDQHEYSESLASINGYLGYFDTATSPLTVKTTDYFMLPPDRFLIGCLQSLHKLHPEFDSYLEEIAKLDESILIVIAAAESNELNQRFIRRIKTAAPTAYKQLCFVQKMTMQDYYSLNSLLDLNLDPIHYGAGITFIETAWCGPPCVTLRGNTVRSAVVSRSYEYAEIVDPPIARSKSEYVNWVRLLMTNAKLRYKLKQEIHQKSKGTIYNNEEYVRSSEAFLQNLAIRGHE
ncbi:hypothetical protein [Cyanobium gracile]|uniref:O-GlcNAc transferase C-terminal domain-containing protein n=1 Tax=Cyanobium gracile (strain ATCC 27147 / PCC 6307) TaxID=292564 RepID=K9P760_CYAGP|nr:hypothetical protein [Cyanobium gracile]AFY28566.1 hypothetical protein Cyagr_1395 [Cyanobium gracile PCC 6307]